MPKNNSTANGIAFTEPPIRTETLPPLPAKREKREASLTPLILNWFRTNYKGSCAIEIKATKSNSIPESALQPHQKAALIAARGAGVVYKIPDTSFAKRPFDAFMLSYTQAFVVACFSSSRVCLVIEADKWKGATPKTPALFRFHI